MSNPSRKRFWTIGRKLMGLMVGLTVSAVAGVTTFMTSRALTAANADLVHKAELYTALTANQVRSAVAFDDKETARESFDALALDRDVEAVALFHHDGSLLHARGMMSERAARARQNATAPRSFALDDQVVGVAPVVSLEGPTGVLVVQLRTDSVGATRREIIGQALLAGVAAVILGVILAFFAARSIARRIRRMAEVTALVAAGQLDQPPMCDDGGDEITQLADGFNWMLERLRALIDEMRRTAETERQRLEALVAERTDQLVGRNADMRQVLENVEQGLLTIDLAGRMGPERSASVERWFGAAPATGSLWDYLDAVQPGLRQRCQMAWSQVEDDFLPIELSLDMMPSSFDAAGRHYAASFREITTPGAARRFLVVISDVTAQIDGARAEAEERETSTLVRKLISDRKGLIDFCEETHELVENVRDRRDVPLALIRRWVHTIKGNAAVFGLDGLAGLCHEIEDAVAESCDRPTDAQVDRLVAAWSRVTQRVEEIAGDGVAGLDVTPAEHREVLEALEAQRPHHQIHAAVAAWGHERIGLRLGRFAAAAEGLARRMGKCSVRGVVDGAELRLWHGPWSRVWAVFPHLVRNAVDHGVEMADERERAGKDATATIVLGCRSEDGAVTIYIEDDGRGIDWDRLRVKAEAMGIEHGPDARIEELLFEDGLSIKDEVTDVSGRGCGLAALREVCASTGGKVSVKSEWMKGTRIEMTWRIPGAATPCRSGAAVAA